MLLPANSPRFILCSIFDLSLTASALCTTLGLSPGLSEDLWNYKPKQTPSSISYYGHGLLSQYCKNKKYRKQYGLMQRCISFIKLRLSMFSKVFICSVRPLPTFLGHLNLESIFGNDRLCDSWFFLVDYCWKHYLCSHIMRKDKRKHTETAVFYFKNSYFTNQPQFLISPFLLPPSPLPSCSQFSPQGVRPLLWGQQNQWENGTATQSSLIVQAQERGE